jgi:hypothetical protein
MSQPAVPAYHIYAAHVAATYSLFIDYLIDEVTHNESTIRQRMQHASDTALAFFLRQCPSPEEVDVFEIESVSTEMAALDAVAFWRAYFRFIGDNVIEGAHVCDHLVECSAEVTRSVPAPSCETGVKGCPNSL